MKLFLMNNEFFNARKFFISALISMTSGKGIVNLISSLGNSDTTKSYLVNHWNSAT